MVPDGSRIVAGYETGEGGMRRSLVVVVAATEAATIVAKGEGAIWLDDHTLLVSA